MASYVSKAFLCMLAWSGPTPFLFLLMLIYGLYYYLICWPGAALAELFFFQFSFGLLSWPGAHWAICLCYFIACLKPDSSFVGLGRISMLLCFNLLSGFVLIYGLLPFYSLAWSRPQFYFISAHLRPSLFCSFMGCHYAATLCLYSLPRNPAVLML